MQKELHDFITQELLNGEHDLGDDDDLLADGLIDSLAAMRLVGFVDETLGIAIPPEDFTINNFRSVRRLNAYLEGRKGAGATST